VIHTGRLRLFPCDEAMLRAIVAGPDEAARHLGVVIPPGWPEFPDAYSHALESLTERGDLRPWWTYVFIDDKRGALVGSGGFAGRPSAEGIVELGYETAPAFRRRGYAREAAGGLLSFAFGRPEIAAVDAHTLAERNASTRVLERNGFKHLGVVEHPDDGTLWHWRVTRTEWAAVAR
jgi:ribosomal-protein-alanine N-acetyltransferase